MLQLLAAKLKAKADQLQCLLQDGPPKAAPSLSAVVAAKLADGRLSSRGPLGAHSERGMHTDRTARSEGGGGSHRAGFLPVVSPQAARSRAAAAAGGAGSGRGQGGGAFSFSIGTGAGSLSQRAGAYGGDAQSTQRTHRDRRTGRGSADDGLDNPLYAPAALGPSIRLLEQQAKQLVRACDMHSQCVSSKL